MRVLFSSTSGSGHLGPLLAPARALADAGHEVRFLLPPEAREPAMSAGFTVEPAPGPEPVESAALWASVKADPTLATKLVNQDYFGRLCTLAMLPAALELCQRWRPDLVLHEACEYGAAIAAHRLTVPHAQVAIGLASVEWGALHHWARHELDVIEPGFTDLLVASPYLTRLPETLDPSEYPHTLRYAEPAVDPDSVATPKAIRALFAASPTAGSPQYLYATLGSMVGTQARWAAVYGALLDAFALLEHTRPQLRVLLTVGRGVDPTAAGPVPASVRIERWVPQSAVFPIADAVLCHGGSGTAFGALAAGLPLVVVPLFADQPSNARLIARAGAAAVVDTDELRKGEPIEGSEWVATRARLARDIAAAVESVLAEPVYRRQAMLLAGDLRALPPFTELVGELA